MRNTAYSLVFLCGVGALISRCKQDGPSGDKTPKGEKEMAAKTVQESQSANLQAVAKTNFAALQETGFCVPPPPPPKAPDAPLLGPGTNYGVVQKNKIMNDRNTIRVHFLNGPRLWRDRVMYWSSRWADHTGIRFVEVNNPGAEIRIKFSENQPGDDKGSWSGPAVENFYYTDLSKPNQNYGWFTYSTNEGEFGRVTMHEMGHALGFQHEHQNPKGGIQWNRPAVYEYFKNQFSPEQIENNILKTFEADSIVGTDFDPDSIMLYFYPKELTLNGVGTKDNNQISSQDKNLARSIYKPLPQFDVFQEVATGVVDFDFDFWGRQWLLKTDNALLRQQMRKGNYSEIGFVDPAFVTQRLYTPPTGGDTQFWWSNGPAENVFSNSRRNGVDLGWVQGLPPWMRMPATSLTLSRTTAATALYSPKSRLVYSLPTVAKGTPWNTHPPQPSESPIADMIMGKDWLVAIDSVNNLFTFSPNTSTGWGWHCGWCSSKVLPHGVGYVSMALGGNRLWAVTSTGVLQQWVEANGSGSWQTFGAPPALKVAANDLGTLWIWGQDRRVYRYDEQDVARAGGGVWKAKTWNVVTSGGNPVVIPEMKRFKADVFGDFAYTDPQDTLRQWVGGEGRSAIRPYSDTEPSPFGSEIYSAMRRNLVSGFPDSTYKPLNPVTREQAATISVNLVQGAIPLPPPAATVAFKDVPATRWSAKAIAMAQQLGIVKGFPDGTFKPETPVTRSQLATMMLGAVKMVRKSKGLPEESPEMAGFDKSPLNTSQSGLAGHWAREFILKMSLYCNAAQNDLAEPWKFQPDATATREYTAAMMVRAANCLDKDLMGR